MKKFFQTDIMLFPFWKELKNFKTSSFKDDLLAAFSVALLTIPQSIAYSLLAGLPPTAGLFSAMFGCVLVGTFGSSKHLIAGPTTAVAILIQTSIAAILYNHYPSVIGMQKERLVFDILTNIILVMGVLQILFGFLNMGKFLQFISRSVILGYFVGVIIAIIINQLFPFLGIEVTTHTGIVIYKLWELIVNLNNIHWITALLGLIGMVIFLFLRKKMPRVPNALVMIIILSFLAYFGRKHLGSFAPVKVLSDMQMSSSFKIFFQLPKINLDMISKIFPAALAITMLGVLEVYSVFRSVSLKSGQLVNTNQEIFSFGIANTFLSFISGAMPTSGSISRTLFNYKNKGKTRFSAIFTGGFVSLFIILFWPLFKYIPFVSLSVILIALVPTLIDYRQLRFCFTVTKGDALVFILTMLSCLIFSLHIAFFIGVFISTASYLKRAAVPHVVEYAFNLSGRLVIITKKKKAKSKIRIIGIAGELFFGSVDLFQATLQKVAVDPYVKVIILRLNNVYYIDASMCYAILHLQEYLKQNKKQLIISGISEEIWQVFARASLIKKIGANNLFLTDENKPQLSTWNACMRAKELII